VSNLPSHASGTPAPRVGTVPDGPDWRGLDHDPEEPARPRADLWTGAKRNLLLIAACSLVAGGTAVAVTSRLTPVYEASTSIRVDQRPSQLPALDALGLSAGNAVGTELEVIQSRAVVEGVADSLRLQLRLRRPVRVPWSSVLGDVTVTRQAEPGLFRIVRDSADGVVLLDRDTNARVTSARAGAVLQAPGFSVRLLPNATTMAPVEFDILSIDEAIERARENITVNRRARDVDIIDITYRDSDPERARDVPNALTRRFIQGRQSVRQAEARSTTVFLRDQIARMTRQLDSAERQLRQFRERERIVSLPDEASTGVIRRAELQAQRNTLDAERVSLAKTIERARAARGNGEDSTPYRQLIGFPSFLRSGAASTMLAGLSAAEERRDELLTRRTPSDPEVRIWNTRVARLQQEIGGLATTYLEGLTEQIAALDATVRTSSASLDEIPRKEIRLAELTRNAKNVEDVYTLLQSRLKEAEIAAGVPDPTVRMIDAAVLPREPISPKPLVNVVLALMGGALLGISGAFAREWSNQTVRTRRELLAASGVPLLGLIPRIPPRNGVMGKLTWRRGRTGLVAQVVDGVSATNSRFKSRHAEDMAVATEALARLATNIAFANAGVKRKTIVITSALPGEGKTAVATNYALASARDGKRVLLIDADLRGGRVARTLGFSEELGLTDVLTGRADLASVIRSVIVDTGAELHVVTAGTRHEHPSGLLDSEAMRRLLEGVRQTYDITVLDTPPVNVVADAAVLGGASDGVVLVARAGVTGREALAFALEQLRMAHAPIIGAALNYADLRGDTVYEAAYQYYDRYSA
jgi:polysaccharide biosynthesis transport protein